MLFSMIIDDAYHYLRTHGLVGHHRTTTTLPLNFDAGLGTHDNATTDRGPANGLVETKKSHVNVKINGSTNGTVNGRSINGTTCNKHVPRVAGDIGQTLLVWSAADSGALERTLKAYAKYYHEKVPGDAKQLAQLAYTLAARRTHMQWRTFAVMNPGQHGHVHGSVPYEHASATLPVMKPTRASAENDKVAFVFTGQGAQYSGMGIDLLVYPVFRDSLARSNDMLAEMGCTWSIIGKDTSVLRQSLFEYLKVLIALNR